MKETTFDALTRHAGSAQGRRASLKALGAAVVTAAIASPSTADAGKSGKKAKKKCKKQLGPCNEFSNQLCSLFFPPGDDFDACVPAAAACCAPLKKCAATPFFDCAIDVISDLLPS